MPRTLLITNDFPPRTGGIQSYLGNFATLLPQDELVVYAPAWAGAAEFDRAAPYPVHRHQGSLMLPVPEVGRRASELASSHDCDTVWFGAAAPLALLGPSLRRRAGVEWLVASTHGHEVAWSQVAGARGVLRRIAHTTDLLTAVSGFTRSRLEAVLGSQGRLAPLPPGIDTDVFRPDPAARAKLRHRYGLGEAPVVTCVSRLVPRKGQDLLITALPRLRARVPGVTLLLVGGGADAGRLRRLAQSGGVAEHVVFTGALSGRELAAHHAVGDVFALPCRTRWGGLDVEGLGIAALEAAACGLPVVVGGSGGAPETVRDGETGIRIDGRDAGTLVTALSGLLADPARAAAMGAAGRAWIRRDWHWSAAGQRLGELLAAPSTQPA